MEQQKKGKEGISLGNLIGGRIDFQDIEEILSRDVMKFGNSGRISIPAKHVGKSAQVTIFKQKKEEEKEN